MAVRIIGSGVIKLIDLRSFYKMALCWHRNRNVLTSQFTDKTNYISLQAIFYAIVIAIPLTQEIIAKLTHSLCESSGKYVTELVRIGIIRFQNKYVTVIDNDALEQMLSAD